MSFDVFFQAFSNGDAGSGGGEQMRQVLDPFVVREMRDLGYMQLECGDGPADVYLSDNSMMANHVSGERVWQLFVEGARAANWVILPMAGLTCIIDEGQRAHLPDELARDVILVSSGDELLKVIRSS